MHSADDIYEALRSGEKLHLLLINNEQDSLRLRKRFVKDVLVGRLGWTIEGWDIMDYCMRLTVVANRLERELNG
jgi:hypothetical protein